MTSARPLDRSDYVQLVREVIGHFVEAVATNLRGAVQTTKPKVLWSHRRSCDRMANYDWRLFEERDLADRFPARAGIVGVAEWRRPTRSGRARSRPI